MKKSGKSGKAKRKTVRKSSPARPARSGTQHRVIAGDLFGDMIVPLDGEPWVKLANGKELAGWVKEDEIRYNQVIRQTGKYHFFRRIFDFLNENEIRGDYLEFGCHRCRTFRMALTEARRHDLKSMKFWAFDSFEGLPDPTTQTSVSKWMAGALTTSEDAFLGMVRAHGIYVDNVRTVKGFYSDSLTPALQQRLLDTPVKAALVTVDCDLYESAVPIFNFLDPFLQEGSVIYMDDLFVGNRGNPNLGVARAFLEYQARSRWHFLPHLEVGWWGRSYIAISQGVGEGRVI